MPIRGTQRRRGRSDPAAGAESGAPQPFIDDEGFTMPSNDWRATWDQHADHARDTLHDLPISELIARVKSGQWGDYYTIWSAIASRAQLSEVGWLLFSVLESSAAYLHRYHCATALLRLLGETRLQAVDVSAEWGRVKNLGPLAHVLEHRMGPRV